jgi:hypothetical protein
MNKLLWIILTALLLNVSAPINANANAGEAQPNPPPPEIKKNPDPEFPKFDFEFPGGSPQELIVALNKRLNGTVNVILPNESQNIKVPALKVKDVTLPKIFAALQRASLRVYTFDSTDGSKRTSLNEFFEITTFDNPPKPSSIWSFRADRVGNPPEENVTRFYQLGRYLDNLKIDDIITAIQTGYRMQGSGPGPNLKFHPETKLLIAVGKSTDFSLIDGILKELAKAPGKDSSANDVMVSGLVTRPGPLPLTDQPMTILAAIGRAGGLSQNFFNRGGGNAPRVQVIFSRPGSADRIFAFDELQKESIKVQPGDVINVSYDNQPPQGRGGFREAPFRDRESAPTKETPEK